MKNIGKTIIDRLEEHAITRPQRTAYRFLSAEVDAMTYEQLHDCTRGVAGFLVDRVKKGDRVAICCSPSLDFIRAYIACLYAGVVAVPTYPPARSADWERLSNILKDSGCVAIMTDDLIAQSLRDRLGESERSIPVYAVSECVANAQMRELPETSADDVAFLQYTSGSTGNPKGVVVTHANLMANENAVCKAFGHDDESDLLGWLPMYHDMGLIGIALQPLYLGTTSTLMSPQTFLKSPLSWLKAISQYRPHTSGAPNFAFELCLKAAEQEDLEGLDLSSWRVAFNGAEPIDADTMIRFAEYFSEYGLRPDAIYPCYGLAESTLYVTGHTRGEVFHTELVDREAMKKNRLVAPSPNKASNKIVGTRNICGHDIRIVDPNSGIEKGVGEVGEIWLKNPSVAAGYWKNEEESARTFQAFSSQGNGPFLRTGDLGALYKDFLFITGRVKDMIILNGRNFYATDIEKCVQNNDPRLRVGYGAAFSMFSAGQEVLVLVQAVKKVDIDPVEAGNICADVKKAVLREMGVIISRVVLIDSVNFPRTSSGKIRRNECREMLERRDLKVVHEWNIKDRVQALIASATSATAASAGVSSARSSEIRKPPVQMSDLVEVKAIIKSWLADGLNMSMTDIPSSATFAEFGIDSVKIAQLVARLEKMYRIDIDPKAAWENPTIHGFAKYVLSVQQSEIARSELEVAEGA
ncbi:MAG: AMP-binding protein [Gammaproteobacteria bacterium]|nr:AMP-binding protein [Gammaproteobacteria bacterium]MBQ0775642.1 AMP-binding protein [Gammaproteobacteria bacterium]